MVTACTNEENVTPCNGVPNAQPHGWHHLTVRVVPLLWQMGYQLLLCHLDLSICHVIDIVDYCGEVFAQLMTTFEVSVSFFPSPDLQEHSSGPCVDSCEHPYQWYGSQKCTDNHTHKSHGRCHLHASCLWTQKKLLLILTLATLLHLLVLLCVCCCCTGVAGSVGSCWASTAAISLIRQPILVFMHGSCSTLEWERAQLGSQCQYVPTLSCWMWTSLPCLQEKAFSTVNFALHPPQCYCISRGARLKRRRVFSSHHSSA